MQNALNDNKFTLGSRCWLGRRDERHPVPVNDNVFSGTAVLDQRIILYCFGVEWHNVFKFNAVG